MAGGIMGGFVDARRHSLCPLCGAQGFKVLYAGIPMRLCEDTECAAVWGGGAWLMAWLPFNGWFVRYERYWPALWALMRGRL
jgi:hypothetical protein